jgi:sugar/nucleoside kinase (ribokinase family)
LAELVERGAKCFHVGYVLLLQMLDGQPIKDLLDSAGRAGLLVSIDVASVQGAVWTRIHDLLPSVDVFCPNLSEAIGITGESDPLAAAQRLKALGVRRAVVIKLGAKGCLLLDEGNHPTYIAGYDVRVANATGAGDAFIGGFLSAWHRGLDWESAARIGNAVAAAVASAGGADGAPDWEEAATRIGLLTRETFESP